MFRKNITRLKSARPDTCAKERNYRSSLTEVACTGLKNIQHRILKSQSTYLTCVHCCHSTTMPSEKQSNAQEEFSCFMKTNSLVESAEKWLHGFPKTVLTFSMRR